MSEQYVSRHKGVDYQSSINRSSPWRAQIWDGSKMRHLGYFASEEEAAEVYLAAAEELERNKPIRSCVYCNRKLSDGKRSDARYCSEGCSGAAYKGTPLEQRRSRRWVSTTAAYDDDRPWFEIELTQGKWAKASVEDIPLLVGLCWCFSAGYAVRNGRDEQMIPMHRVILGLADDDPREVDHKNGDGLDNRTVQPEDCYPASEWSQQGQAEVPEPQDHVAVQGCVLGWMGVGCQNHGQQTVLRSWPLRHRGRSRPGLQQGRHRESRGVRSS